jgi:ligand-binding sensor domain-containing protein
LLLATPRGLRTLDPTSGRVATASIAAPGYPVGTLARDGLGRLWLAGQGLWMASPDGAALHRLDALPMLGRTRVYALGRDVDHPDGVIVSLGPRGVVFVGATGDR